MLSNCIIIELYNCKNTKNKKVELNTIIYITVNNSTF